MLSFNKLLVLCAIIAVVWYVFKFLANLERERAQMRRAAARGAAAANQRIATEDLVKCRVCDTYVSARDPRRCGRSDCTFHA